MEKKDVIIELTGVSKVYDGTTVVDNFNLYVNKGEFITFLGPSGCGKTTTLRMIAGFEIPTSGTITLNGVDITNLPPYKRPINTVFQRYALFPHLDVYDNIAFGLKLRKVNITNDDGTSSFRKYREDEIDDKVTRVLKLVDLEEFEDRDVTTLSGGQQQRVAIARAIVNEPEILLLDEPLGALDLKMRKDMQLELKAMHEKLGITFIYVTHDQEEALTMSDTIVVMRDGKIQQIGTPIDIYNEPKNAYVADFIGESNIYNGTMIGPKVVRFIGANHQCVDEFPLNEKVDVVVRPEDVKIGKIGEGNADGIIDTKIFKGIHYEYVVMVGKNEVVVQSTEDYPLKAKVSLTIEPEGIHIMAKELVANIYTDAWINAHNQVMIDDAPFECDIAQLVNNGKVDDEGNVYTTGAKAKKYNFNDADVIAEVPFDAIEIIDNDEDGIIAGEIIQSIYKGDHYQVIIRTKDEEDFVADTPYTWNPQDRVSVKIDSRAIKIKIKGDLGKYEI
ncbi:MAG: ABC transporter ATP-binding protein [Bacilli bacterium]|jgi:spermidine/putrescine transport system ATP-binding protein|nr:ABC transporter ATP-binding protein [Bacilli bacterium]MCH4235234.1 ABC transporter ATP-binding protein [Bacilli bacterium]